MLGVDVGTYGSKGVVVNQAGRVLATSFAEHGVDSPRLGWYEHDPERVWWNDLTRIIQELLDRSGIDPREVAALGVSGLSPEVTAVDAEGRVLRPAILYSDTRAAAESERIIEKLGEQRILDVGGNALSVQSAGPKVLWLRDHEPEVFGRTRYIYDAPSYLTYLLTGVSRMDYGQACWFHPLFNIRDLKWDESVCTELGISSSIFPPLGWATEVAGGISRSAAQATGLVEGTPVITGTGDGPAEQVAVGASEEGEAALVYGSTMCLLALSNTPRVHARAAAAIGAVPGRRLLMTYMNASAALTRWFRDNFGQVEREAEASLGINAYQLLSAEAAQVPPGSEGLVVLPYFAGEGHPILDTSARGLILGLTLSHKRGHLYRALLEGVAYGLRHNLETFQEAGLPIRRYLAVGGGTKSKLWTQIVSDVVGINQELVSVPFGAPFADAYLAGYGVGMFRDMRTLRDEWAQISGRVSHQPELWPVYDRYYQVYRALYEPLKKHMHTLAELSMAARD